MGKNLPGYGFESEDFRRHSLAVALSSKVIAEKIDPSLANEAHTAGLIHDIGKIILDKYHHYPSSSQGDGLSYILHLADYIAAKSGGGYDSDDLLYQLEEGTLDYIDLRYEDVKIIMSEVIEAMAQLSDES